MATRKTFEDRIAWRSKFGTSSLNCRESRDTSADSAIDVRIDDLEPLEIVETKEEHNQGDTLQPEIDRKLKIHIQEAEIGVREQLLVCG